MKVEVASNSYYDIFDIPVTAFQKSRRVGEDTLFFSYL